MLDFRLGQMGGDDEEISESFKVNQLVDHFSIRVTHDRTDNDQIYNYQLFKDGQAMPFDGLYDGNSLHYSIPFPHQFPDSTFLEGGGIWELRFSGSDGSDYEITALVEDKYIDTDASVNGGAVLYAGDEIKVEGTLSVGGAPITDATATSILLRPGEDLGDFAANQQVASNLINPLENQVPSGGQVNQSHLQGLAKIDYLLSNPDFVENIRQQPQSLPMTHVGNGVYEATFADNIPSGTYRAVVIFDGTAAGLGEYEGWETRCILVENSRPEDLDLNLTVNTVTVGSPDIAKQTTIQIRPTNKFGKLLGPGKAHRIKVEVEGYGIVTMTDNLDGTYTGTIVNPPSGDPNMTIHVLDTETPVHDGPIDTGGTESGFGLSAHGGYIRALSSTTDLPQNTGGGFGEIDLAYRFNKNWAVEALGGYYNFENGYSVVGVSLFGEYTYSAPNPNGWYYRLAAGVGLFDPDSRGLTYGLGLKGGAARQVNANLDVGVDVGYFNLPDPSVEFLTVGLGLRYYF